jgi:hypothetical protein
MPHADTILPGTGHWHLLHSLYLMHQWTLLISWRPFMSPVSPADSLHYATGDVSWRLFTSSQQTLLISWRPFMSCHSRHLCPLQTLYIMPQGMSPEDSLLHHSGHCLSPGDPLRHATVDTCVSCRLFTLCYRGCLLKTPYFITVDTGLCLLQTPHTAPQRTLVYPRDLSSCVTLDTLVSPADPIHCGIVDINVSCRPSELHHITSICIYATAMNLVVTSKHQTGVSATICGNRKTHQQLWQITIPWHTSQNGGPRNRIWKKSHDGSHCVKWNDILFIEFSELLKVSIMYKKHFNFIHEAVSIIHLLVIWDKGFQGSEYYHCSLLRCDIM